MSDAVHSPALSEEERFIRLADQIGISSLSRRRRTEMRHRVQRALRENCLDRNPDANKAMQLAKPDKLEWAVKHGNTASAQAAAKEIRRRILKDRDLNPAYFWPLAEKALPATQDELEATARAGYVAPLLQKLKPGEAIPDWACNDQAAYWAWQFRNEPWSPPRIEELLAKGIYTQAALQELLVQAFNKQDMDRVIYLLQKWLPNVAIAICPVDDLATARRVAQIRPDAISNGRWAKLFFNAGDKDQALARLEQLSAEEKADLARQGIPTGDIDWMLKCCNDADSQITFLHDLLDRRRYHRKKDPGVPLSLIKTLLTDHGWKKFLESNEYVYGLGYRLIETGDAELLALGCSHLPKSESVTETLYRTKRLQRFLPQALANNPADHSKHLWEAISAPRANRLARLARQFDCDSATSILKKVGDAPKRVRHILDACKPDVQFYLGDVFQMPAVAAQAVFDRGLISPHSQLCCDRLDKTFIGKELLNQILGPSRPWMKDDALRHQLIYQHWETASRLLEAGHPLERGHVKYVLSAANSLSEEDSKRKVRAVKGLLAAAAPWLSTMQLAALMRTRLQAEAVELAKARQTTGKLTGSLLHAMLFNGRQDLYVQWWAPKYKADRKVLKKLIELENWAMVAKLLRHQPALKTPEKRESSDGLFHAENQAHWERMLELGLRPAKDPTQIWNAELILALGQKGLLSLKNKVELLVDEVANKAGGKLIQHWIPLPPEAAGTAVEMYRAGKLALSLLRHCVEKDFAWSEIEERVRNRVLDLQAEAGKAQLNPRACLLHYGNEDCRWQEVTGQEPPHDSLRAESPYGFSPRAFKAILGAALQEAYHTKTDPGQVVKPAFNLAVALGNLTEVRKILKKRNEGNKTPIHDLGQFQLPKRGSWDIGAWRKLLAHHSGRGRELLHLAANIEKVLGRAPTSMREAEEIAAKAAYLKADQHLELAKLCLGAHLDEDSFEDYLQLLNRAKQTDDCPDLHLSEADTGTDCTFDRLAPGDPRGPMLGLLTNCCQHLHGYAKDCAVLGVTHPEASFYIVSLRKKIVAQCFAWRRKDVLVWDSWEHLQECYRDRCQKVLTAAANEALRMDPTLNEIRLGTGGRTPSLQVPVAQHPKRWPRPLVGSDAESQYVLATRAKQAILKVLPSPAPLEQAA